MQYYFKYDVCTIDHSNGHRSSSQYFVDNAKGLSNLHVITNAMAQKINFDSNNTAVSVTYTALVGLVSVTIGATKEVLVSAGAFQSPQVVSLFWLTPLVRWARYLRAVIANGFGYWASSATSEIKVSYPHTSKGGFTQISRFSKHPRFSRPSWGRYCHIYIVNHI